MKEFLITIFGSGEDLGMAHMGARAFVMFFIALVVIRIAGRRSFAMRSSSDNIVVILLGAILSRAVTGASPFFSTVLAGLIIALLHRLVAWLCTLSPGLETLLKGHSRLLYKDGRMLKGNMRKALISEHDLVECVRRSTGGTDFSIIDEVRMERNGEISIVRKDGGPCGT